MIVFDSAQTSLIDIRVVGRYGGFLQAIEQRGSDAGWLWCGDDDGRAAGGVKRAQPGVERFGERLRKQPVAPGKTDGLRRQGWRHFAGQVPRKKQANALATG